MSTDELNKVMKARIVGGPEELNGKVLTPVEYQPTFKTVRMVPALSVFDGEPFVYTVLKHNAGTTPNLFTLIYEDSDGEFEMKRINKNELIKTFGANRAEHIIELLNKK